MDKQDIRKLMQEKRNNLSNIELTQKSKIIQDKLLSMQEYKLSKCIYIYMDFNKEVITKGIINDALKDNKKVAIPKITNNQMLFYYINDIDEVSIGSFNILEPTTADIANEKNALVIMPGVAFDKNRNRIGYGKGYYDTFLQKHKSMYKIALAFDFQILDEIPCEEVDILPDVIITESKII